MIDSTKYLRRDSVVSTEDIAQWLDISKAQAGALMGRSGIEPLRQLRHKSTRTTYYLWPKIKGFVEEAYANARR